MDVVYFLSAMSRCTISSSHSWLFSSRDRLPQRFSNSQPVCCPWIFSRVVSQASTNTVPGLTLGKNAANYISWLNNLQPVVQETPENRDQGPKSGGPIDVDRLRFSYPLRPDTTVLKGVDLHVSDPPCCFHGNLWLTWLFVSTDQEGTVCGPGRSLWLRKIHHDCHV